MGFMMFGTPNEDIKHNDESLIAIFNSENEVMLQWEDGSTTIIKTGSDELAEKENPCKPDCEAEYKKLKAKYAEQEAKWSKWKDEVLKTGKELESENKVLKGQLDIVKMIFGK